jgi:hypothetical protein
MNSVYEICMIFQKLNVVHFPNNNSNNNNTHLVLLLLYCNRTIVSVTVIPTTMNCVWAVVWGICEQQLPQRSLLPTSVRGMGNQE